MRVRDHRLRHADDSPVPFEKTRNRRRGLRDGAPRFIVIHYTASADAHSVIERFKDPDAEVSAHLVVDHDGSITQMVKFSDIAWHAGESAWNGLRGLNRYSVGIEIVNWGWLNGERGAWKSWRGVSVPDDRVVRAAHRDRSTLVRGWEIFDSVQIDSVANAVRALAEAYGIGRDEVIGHDDISPLRKQDPGPAWSMDRFRTLVFGRRSDESAADLYRVLARRGLHLRRGPGIEHEAIKTLDHESLVSRIDNDAAWWLVSEIDGREEDTTGWVYSRWLGRA